MAPGTLNAAVMPIDQTWEWYEDQRTANRRYRRLLLDALITGVVVEEKFEDFNSSGIATHFDQQAVELDHLACFAFISAAEGQLHADYSDRVRQRGRTPLGRAFRDLKALVSKRKEPRVKLEQDLIEAWKKAFPDHKGIFSDFVGALKYRHWLAHGRHWNEQVGRRYTPENVYEIVRKVADVMANS